MHQCDFPIAQPVAAIFVQIMGVVPFGAANAHAKDVAILAELNGMRAVDEQQDQHFKHRIRKLKIGTAIVVGILRAIRLQPREAHVQHRI